MKNHNIRRTTKGFTLVELLIVISIIMVLAALGFAGVQAAMKKSKTVQSQNLVTNLALAVNNYYDEYGSLPIAEPSEEELSTHQVNGTDLITVLLGKERESSTILNTRNIKFLEAKQATGRKPGIVYSNNNEISKMNDGFGEPIFIEFDSDYDEEINISDNRMQFSNQPDIVRGVRCVVYSYGADRLPGTKDDVKSW
jgi:prepilin-type N-terminal cleavage/methylation domain-containing protein